MRLTCPECATAYDVPETALTTGRRLRCSVCATNWEWTAPSTVPEPMSAALEAPPPQPTEPEPARAVAERAAPEAPPPRIEAVAEERMAPPPSPAPEGRGGGGTAMAWAASLVVIVIAVAALYVWRAPVMHAWPPATRLYTVLGIA